MINKVPFITDNPCISCTCQIAREAEAAIFHRQLFEELRRVSPLTCDPTEATAVGAVEASFKCSSGAIIVLTKSGSFMKKHDPKVLERFT